MHQKEENVMKHTRINRDRLADTFLNLVRIDSPSRHEGRVAKWLKDWFKDFPGAVVTEDGSAIETGSDTGNLVIRLKGNQEKPPLFFNAHMDTVEPGRGIKPVFDGSVFKSDGATVLGGDDKAAIAILLEAVNCLQENKLNFGPIELVFTTCEEIGLLGAKALDTSILLSKAGFALDSTDPDAVINRAPAAIRFNIEVHGLSAHAGINPDKGINAIKIAAEAITKAPQGRIDEDTTCNIGLIKGGTATNIIPALVEVEGEVRSHEASMLRKIQDEIIGCFHQAVENYHGHTEDIPKAKAPFINSAIRDDYPLMSVPEGHPIVTTVLQAGKGMGRNLYLKKTGGGSDANIFNQKGLTTVILGIGMQKVHTTAEFIRLSDMVASCHLVLEIIKYWRG